MLQSHNRKHLFNNFVMFTGEETWSKEMILAEWLRSVEANPSLYLDRHVCFCFHREKKLCVWSFPKRGGGRKRKLDVHQWCVPFSVINTQILDYNVTVTGSWIKSTSFMQSSMLPHLKQGATCVLTFFMLWRSIWQRAVIFLPSRHESESG